MIIFSSFLICFLQTLSTVMHRMGLPKKIGTKTLLDLHFIKP